MKKLNKIKIVTLIFICFFVVNINVFAKCEDYSIAPTKDTSVLKEAEQKCNSAEEDGYKCQWYQEGNVDNFAPTAWCIRTEEKYIPPQNSNNNSNNNEETDADTSSLECSSWGDVLVDIQNLFNFLKVVIPLLIIGLSTYDFIKAVAGKDSKDVKKAFKRLLKRFIYALIFFFLPIIINFVLKELIGVSTSVCIEG